MKVTNNFEFMIEIARMYPLYDFCREGGGSDEISLSDKVHFFSLVEKCHPFIIYMPESGLEHGTEPGSSVLDLPFETCSFELFDEGVQAFELEDQNFYLMCAMVNERPGGFESYCLFRTEDDSQRPVVYYIESDGPQSPGRDFIQSYVRRKLELLNEYVEGHEPGRRRVRIGTGKTKRVVKLNTAIHIIPGKKTQRNPEHNYALKNIDFTHRFIRRGHWRRLDETKTGKNRVGAYVEAGRTWVMESKPIGPGDKPLLNKTRIVRNNNMNAQSIRL